jgi:diguanylate cyclase (GGDEF)-like protein
MCVLGETGDGLYKGDVMGGQPMSGSNRPLLPVRQLVRLLAIVPRRGVAPGPVGLRAHVLARLGDMPKLARIWIFIAAMVATAVCLFALELNGRTPLAAGGLEIPWPVLAVGFCLAELKVVEVHFRRESHSFSLSEFPAVIGFFFLTPLEYFAALLAGAAAALLLTSRQSGIKLAFNLSNFAVTAAVSLSVFYWVNEVGGHSDVVAWGAALAATLSATLLSALTIASIITMSGGAPQFQKLPQMLQFGGLVAVANTSLALLAVSLLRIDAVLILLLAAPLATVFLAYGAYVSEHEKHERLELLYQSSRILQHSPELDSTIVALLDHARNMFRAEWAEIVLYPRGEAADPLRTTSWQDQPAEVMVPFPNASHDPIQRRVHSELKPFFLTPDVTAPPAGRLRRAMVSPLRGESGVIGSIVVANRLTEGTTFSGDDLRLLETLANQAAVALENGQLEQSLAELSRLKEELRYQAYHDPLTNLANRRLFVERVDERLAHSTPGLLPIVLFLDLDDFKVVNDTLGHAAGDRLLAAVAERIRSCIRDQDVAARLGGDEFAILIEDRPDMSRAMGVANRINEALVISFPIQGQEITVSASIGIASGEREGERADDLLRNADVAMYTAKASGKARAAVFDPTIHAAIVARHQLSAELTRSLGQGELAVFYQPIVSLESGALEGVEALVRWQHPVRGLVGPDDFIPLAEENGTIIALGRWVLEQACRQAVAWQSFGPPKSGLTVTVNLSAAQLQEASFIAEIEAILVETGLKPSQLVLEMTETAMFHDTTTTIARLESLRALGIRIAVDDFGTGYSSLGYLRRFQVDILKIAREFVDENADEWAFAGAIVALGRTLGLKIVAEGIEEAWQLERLLRLGCEFGQGYYFARPSDAAGFEAYYAARHARWPHGIRARGDRHRHLPGAAPIVENAPST